MLVAGRPRGQDAGRDRGRVRGGVPRRRGRGQHPARARLPARHRAHPRDGGPGRAAPGCGLCVRLVGGQRLLRRRRRSRATAGCRATRSTSCAPGIAARSSRTSATRRTSRSGRRPARAASSSGRPTRWGDGYPGWHLECSAMAMRYLGDRFDIHTGGIDNVFPHHEDEIAQSAPLVGGPPANHWVHGEFLLMSGKKMAKSAGNFQRVTELADRGVDPLALRYLAMTSRYSAQARVLGSRRSPRRRLRSTSLRSRLRALDRRRTDGPWTAPTPLRGGRGGRPAAGRRRGPGRSWRWRTVDPDRSGARPRRAVVGGGARAPSTGSSTRSTTTSTCSTALAVVREILRAPTCPPTSGAGWSSTRTSSSGSGLHAVWEIGGRRRRDPGRRQRARRGPDGRPSGQGLRARRCAPRRDRSRRMDGDRQRRRSDGQADRVSRSRRDPNRSMIR